MSAAHAPVVPTLTPSFDVVVTLGELEDHGDTRAGHRRIVPITGGSVSGDVQAWILPGGADWQLLRADGAIDIDGRYSARTAEGELLFLRAVGVRTGDPAALEALLRGEDVPPSEYTFRTAVTVETSAPRLAWMEHALFVASCVRDAGTVRYRAYRVG